MDVLDTSGWFERGNNHDGGEMNAYGVWIPRFKYGTFVWGPAPAVAIIVIEELRQARHNWNQSAHVLGVERLFWSKWRSHI